MGVVHSRILVHGTNEQERSIVEMALLPTTTLFLVVWIFQPSRMFLSFDIFG